MIDTPGIYEFPKDLKKYAEKLPSCEPRTEGVTCDMWGETVQILRGHCMHAVAGMRCCHCGERLEVHD